jgi:MoaA/NifB/PqqE/SkfB family radical SAM enzyme
MQIMSQCMVIRKYFQYFQAPRKLSNERGRADLHETCNQLDYAGSHMKPNGNGLYIVKINNSCNANCLFCADTITERQKAGPTLSALVAALKENRQSFQDVIISGGEPTMYPHLLEYLDAAQSLQYRHVSISTNGFMLSYPRFTQALISRGVEQFIFSFQTTDSNKYETITRLKNSFALITKGMENVRRYGGQVAVNTVIHKLNYTELPEIVTYLIQSGAYNIQLSFMNPIGVSVENGHSKMAVSFTNAMPYIQKCLVIAENHLFRNLFIENTPICVLGRYADRSADRIKRDVNQEYYCASKTKVGKCKTCTVTPDCDGVWIQYLAQFGDAELIPITTGQNKRISDSEL